MNGRGLLKDILYDIFGTNIDELVAIITRNGAREIFSEIFTNFLDKLVEIEIDLSKEEKIFIIHKLATNSEFGQDFKKDPKGSIRRSGFSKKDD